MRAWSYLYARYLVLRQENYDVNVEKVGYNRIKYNPLGSAQFVNPNLDVAYLWLPCHVEKLMGVSPLVGRTGRPLFSRESTLRQDI